MFRKKVKVAWVESDRTIMFQKRKRRILNKVRELTTVCGVNAVVIFRGPHGNKPTVWHSGQVTEESRKLIEHFEPDLDLPSSSFSPYEGEDEEKMMSKIGGFKNDMHGI
ncbi:hypothetical protein D8674_025784 [Pyrus ussuriensis x Pyrus communis]|uniref:MADS-box domain-containing protein n=1 Tax=Pyrus ussuriensis x Pyrus communis TaxID=2448454 RepID=A0A5N5IC03_9ROSA|nr:hypothetical protein D8674_025784 [Pyrus ussuriensis x Pyrus communis]